MCCDLILPQLCFSCVVSLSLPSCFCTNVSLWWQCVSIVLSAYRLVYAVSAVGVACLELKLRYKPVFHVEEPKTDSNIHTQTLTDIQYT